jgi:hypothetical protein
MTAIEIAVVINIPQTLYVIDMLDDIQKAGTCSMPI